MSDKILEKQLQHKFKDLTHAKVCSVYTTPVNMLWLKLEIGKLYYELIFDGFWLIEKNKKIILINQDFYEENEKDFMLRLSNTIESLRQDLAQIERVNIGENWGYIELVFNQDYILLAEPNQFGYVGLNDLKDKKAYSIVTECKNLFFEEPYS